MKRISILTVCIFILFPMLLSAQKIASFEYFFDKDPGLGKGTIVKLGAKNIDSSFKLNTSNLSIGLHVVYVRAIDSANKYSLTNYSSFILNSGMDSVLNLTRIEYFFDKDPGLGKATPFTISNSNPFIGNYNINAADNGKETTKLYIRAQDSYGRWSMIYDTTINLCTLLKTKANFNFVRYASNYSLIDSSSNNSKHIQKWYVDDKLFDTIANPIKLLSYGNHTIKLVSGFGCRADSISKNILTKIESYYPKNITAGGYFNLTVYGGGLDSNTVINILDSTGNKIPIIYKTNSKDNMYFKVQFDLHNVSIKSINNFDIVISNSISKFDTTIKKGLLVNPKPTDTTLLDPKYSIELNQPKEVSPNTWYNGNVVIHNIGLIGGKYIPVTLCFPVEFQDVQILNPISSFDSVTHLTPLPNNFNKYDGIKNINGINYKVFYLYIPDLGPNETFIFNFKVLTPTDLNSIETFKYLTFVGKRSIGSIDKDFYDCTCQVLSAALSISAVVFPPAAVPLAVTASIVAISQNIGDYQIDKNENNKNAEANFLKGVALNATSLLFTAAGTTVVTTSEVASQVNNQVYNIVSGLGSQADNLMIPSTPCVDWFYANKRSKIQGWRGSHDPNQLISTYSSDSLKHYISKNDFQNFTIEFENDKSATKSARSVVLIDTLNKSKYDLNSFKLSNFKIGDSVFMINDFRNEYTTTVNYKNNYIRFNSKLDTVTGILSTSYFALDSITKDYIPDTSMTGFLPPNTNGKDGIGQLSFIIKPNQNVVNQDTITNKALIYFDNNTPIYTNTFKHTIDNSLPIGNIVSYKILTDTTIKISVSKNDKESGVNYYDLMYSKNNSTFRTYQKFNSSDTLSIKLQKDSLYKFYVNVYDNVGNALTKSTAEITVPMFNINPINGDSILCVNNTSIYKVSSTGGKWFVSDSSFAKVDSTGKLTGLKAGNVTLFYSLSSFGVSDTVAKQIKISQVNQPIITRDTSNYLNSNNPFGNVWYKDGSVITDTAQKFKPTAPGSYTLKTNQNGCVSAFSNAYYYLVTDIVNLENGEYIKLAPNPFQGNLYVDFSVHGYQSLIIEVYELATGIKVVQKNNVYSGTSMQFNGLNPGTYIIRVLTSDLKINHQFKMVKL